MIPAFLGRDFYLLSCLKKAMNNIPKLLLYSMSLTEKHYAALEKLTGKKANDMYFACIENSIVNLGGGTCLAGSLVIVTAFNAALL